MKKQFFASVITLVTLFLCQNMANAQCPNFLKDQSNPYYILFSNSVGIHSSGQPKIINGLQFVDAGHWTNSGIHYASWTNTSGQPLDINNFTIQFGSLTCTFSNTTLGILEAKDLNAIPKNRQYKIYSIDGKLLQSGTTSDNFYKELPIKQVIFLHIEGYKVIRLRINNEAK
jgi:hypothetical protein